MSNTRIAFVGAGNMACSLIGGLRAQGLDASLIRASCPRVEQRSRIHAEHGIETFADNHIVVEGADVVVLAVKPQAMKSVCEALRPHLLPRQLVVSIAAGITSVNLAKWLGDVAIVRCMPNTPAMVRQGVSGLYANARVSAEQRTWAEGLLSAVGLALWLNQEQQLDAVTAVSGSGPAYFFLLIEAMTAAGEKLGLPRETAAQLTLHTAFGAARMALGGEVEAGELRRRVTSPGGTTEAAIKVFQVGGFESLVDKALTASAHRSTELANPLEV